MNEKMYDKETLERILAERDARHQAELEKVKAEIKLQGIETRLAKLEDELNSSNQDGGGGIGGFSLTDIVSAYTMMQKTKGGTQ